MKRRVLLAAAVLLSFSTWATTSSALPDLAPHRAIYDITLDHTTGSDFIAARGRMAVQFKDTCDGWSTAQRMIADMTDAKGTALRTDFFVTAWESKDGRTMRFDVSDSRDGRTLVRQRGSASLETDGSGVVEFAAHKHKGFPLPKGTQFPTTQVLDLLRGAEAGRTSLKHIVFQGGDRSNLYLSTAVIGKAPDPAKLSTDRAADKSGILKAGPVWSALISFFPLSARAEQADYEVATRLYANGVNGSMTLIYPTYTLRATLVRLEVLHRTCSGATR